MLYCHYLYRKALPKTLLSLAQKLEYRFIFLSGISFSHVNAALQQDLETSYKAYTEALESNDPAKIQSSMSAHGFIHLKNIIVSAKLKYPEAFLITAGEKLVNLKKEKY